LQGDHLTTRFALAAESQNALDQFAGSRTCFRYLRKPALHWMLVGQLAAHEARVAGDGEQDVIEVVRDTPGERAERFDFLRVTQRLLGLLARGYIHRRTNQSLRTSSFVALDAAVRDYPARHIVRALQAEIRREFIGVALDGFSERVVHALLILRMHELGGGRGGQHLFLAGMAP
jgi:hypothetical protein